MFDCIISQPEWQPEVESFVQEQHLDQSEQDMVAALIRETTSLAPPQGGYLPLRPHPVSETAVTLNGTNFNSHLLATHLSGQDLVFPFVSTCGPDLSAWAQAKTDILENYLATALAEKALQAVTEKLRLDIEDRFDQSNLSRMQPGSLPDWPIQEQSPLFSLLNSVAEAIQVRLTSSLLMLPTHSLSGVFFQDPEGFISCQLCSRPDCPRRKAPFDPQRLAKLQGDT